MWLEVYGRFYSFDAISYFLIGCIQMLFINLAIINFIFGTFDGGQVWFKASARQKTGRFLWLVACLLGWWLYVDLSPLRLHL